MNKPEPKYLSISRKIIQKIQSGELLPGNKIPSENELIKEHLISNTTARKILHEIELQGWVTRIKGKGTFVLNKTEDKHLTRSLGSLEAVKESFSGNLIKEGFKPKNIILEKTILKNGLSSKIENRNYMIEGPVLKLHRLRYADDMLLKDETVYISMNLCPKINLIDLDQYLIGIYEQKYHLKLENVYRTIGSMVVNPSEKNNYFENKEAIPAFVLDGVIFSDKGEIVEIERSLYRGDKYIFSINTNPKLQ